MEAVAEISVTALLFLCIFRTLWVLPLNEMVIARLIYINGIIVLKFVYLAPSAEKIIEKSR